MPVLVAKNSEFQATPQRVSSTKQAKPQMSGAPNRLSAKPASHAPVASVKARSNERTTG